MKNFTKSKHAVSRLSMLLVLTLLILLTLSSCMSHLIADQMVRAPNKSLIGYELSRQFSPYNSGHDGLLSIDGVKQKSIHLPSRGIDVSFIEIEPNNYGFDYLTKPVIHESGKIWRIATHWKWLEAPCNNSSQKLPPQKTLVLLHGWGRNKNSLLNYGLALSQHGYRVIIPDLRGHGNSTGNWVSFGAEEGQDVSVLMDLLKIETFDILGFSLGASVGLHIASVDDRVNHLVVIAPMHSLEQTIPKFAKQSPKWISDLVLHYQYKALKLVNNISGYTYEVTSDAVSPAQLITKPVLFIYGGIDSMSNYELNYLLFKQGSTQNKLKKFEGLRHTHLLLHQSAIMPTINQWLGLTDSNRSNLFNNDCIYKSFNY